MSDVPPPPTADCPVCKGIGRVWQWRTRGNPPPYGEYWEPCDACGGTGRVAALTLPATPTQDNTQQRRHKMTDQATDHDNRDDAPVAASNHSALRTITVSDYALRASIKQLGHDINVFHQQITDATQERDNLVRRGGRLQERIDSLTQQREALSRHLRDLLAAVEGGK